jgi:hypothetical protein
MNGFLHVLQPHFLNLQQPQAKYYYL